jgi:hypothetical protein
MKYLFLNIEFGRISHKKLSCLGIYLVIPHETHECLIHEDHAILFAELEDGIEILRLSSDDEIADGVIVEHELTSYNHTSGITFGQ